MSKKILLEEIQNIDDSIKKMINWAKEARDGLIEIKTKYYNKK